MLFLSAFALTLRRSMRRSPISSSQLAQITWRTTLHSDELWVASFCLVDVGHFGRGEIDGACFLPARLLSGIYSSSLHASTYARWWNASCQAVSMMQVGRLLWSRNPQGRITKLRRALSLIESCSQVPYCTAHQLLLHASATILYTIFG